MDNNKMNKKGTIILRDVMFMIILFGGVMSLMSLVVLDMATEYSNTNLTTDYNALGVSGLGDTVSSDINKTITTQREATLGEGEGEEGTIEAIGIGDIDIIRGASAIVGGVFKSPTIIKNALSVMLADLGVPIGVVNIVAIMIIGLILIVIIFGIITALLKGGKM